MYLTFPWSLSMDGMSLVGDTPVLGEQAEGAAPLSKEWSIYLQ